MNSAIIVAAGSGTRFGGERPKQFLEICGKPLLIHTLQPFERCALIGEIVLVLPAAEIENFKSLAASFKLTKITAVVAGGAARVLSVLNGLNAVSASAEIVAVHDGARPLVSVEEISATIEKAREAGAACLSAPVTETIKEAADGVVTRTIDRSRLRRALTPQAFRVEVLRRAFAEADLNEAVTDESYLVEQSGGRVALVDGSAKNIKITTREDFALAELFLKEAASGVS